jgi:hypothetical protein
VSSRVNKRLEIFSRSAHSGAVSTTIVVNFRCWAADFRKASTVRDRPIVRMISLFEMCEHGRGLDVGTVSLIVYMVSRIFGDVLVHGLKLVQHFLNGLDKNWLNRSSPSG